MFVFRLQSVLEHRKRIEDELISSVSAMERHIMREEGALTALLGKKDAVSRDLAETRNKGLRVSSLSVLCDYIDVLRSEENIKRKTIHSLKEKLAGEREKLRRAAKERKIIEKLREQHYAAYTAEMDSREKRELDELGVLRHGRE